MNATERSAEDLKTDDEKWKANVAPILGDTDMIIFAFGADIGDWEGYSSDNPKFQYYKSAGYDYFCNVDSVSTLYRSQISISDREEEIWMVTECIITRIC